MERNTYHIYQGDCLEYMDYMHDIYGSFADFIFADPPYFLSNDGITCVNGRMVKVNKGNGINLKAIRMI